ncbi:MAG TPA: GSCFA domain-containing protein [Rhizomicrobium sp.]
MDHPYVHLPAKAYWRQAISDVNALHLENIYEPRFQISKSTRVAAAGSCFAQHIGRQFKQRGYGFVDVEPPPPLLTPESYHKFGYDLYSARYGNVYSPRQLLQLFQRAYGELHPPGEFWFTGGRYYDPFRPSIEEGGFSTEAEAAVLQSAHLAKVREILPQTQIFVFTFGLTEAWIDADTGIVYPTCPGTIAGEFDPNRHRFHNFSFSEIIADVEAFISLARGVNPRMQFLFTVSPVPLTATASGGHVLPATIYSKSVLRAVCGELHQRHKFVDYFPSYELVASHPMRAVFFDPNLRTVATRGVEHVMNVFFSAHGGTALIADVHGQKPDASAPATAHPDDIFCDEEFLDGRRQ